MKTYLVHLIATSSGYEKIVSNLVVASCKEAAIIEAINGEAHNELYLLTPGVYAENDDSFTYSARTVHEIEPQDVDTLKKYGIHYV